MRLRARLQATLFACRTVKLCVLDVNGAIDMSQNETPPRPSWRPNLIGKRYAIACGHYLAAMAAACILERGGNAIDAGVTAAMALAALQPDIVSFSGVAPTLVFRKKDR